MTSGLLGLAVMSEREPLNDASWARVCILSLHDEAKGYGKARRHPRRLERCHVGADTAKRVAS